ncbi:MAG: UDP-N-acetylmuramate dehydrogenase [Candidatus Omnitrophota bacterium]
MLLKDFTTFKIGGPAKLFFRPNDISRLRQVIKSSHERGEKILILGAGSNILADDRGVDAVVVKLDAKCFQEISNDGGIVEAGAGKPLSQLLAYCSQKGLSGAEFLAGIPGTVGGALAMNAGISINNGKLAIGDLVERALVLDYNNNLRVLERAKLKFGYRQSNLAKYVILGVSLKLIPRDPESVKKKLARYLSFRKTTQDWAWPNAGCVFKNPENDSAGRLIDSCGLKGRRIGGAQVSCKHANFILNVEHASSQDVLGLMREIKKTVKIKHKIILKPEIKAWK